MRIFAPIQNFNWENVNIIEGLRQCGHEVIQYDWKAKNFNQYDKRWLDDDYEFSMSQMNMDMLTECAAAYKEKPFDLLFGYVSDPNIFEKTLAKFRTMGMPYMINYSCNNTMSFIRTHDITGKHFDCHFYAEGTGYVEDLFKNKGLKAIHFPFAINPEFYHSSVVPVKKYSVGFIGQLYGYRARFMQLIAENNFSVVMASKINYQDMFDLVQETAINMGFRGISAAQYNDITAKQIRLRDFEIPALGGLYLTENFKELNKYFEIDKEILTFNSTKEMLEKINHYINNTEEREKIAIAGQKRILKDHTWRIRFNSAFKELGLM